MSGIDFTKEELKIVLSATMDYLDICDPGDDEMMGNIIGKLTDAME